MAPPRRPASSVILRAHLAFALAVAVVPAGLVGMALVGYDDYQRERAQVILGTTAVARAVAAGVDADMAGTRAALYALASSPALRNEDLAGFHAQASAALTDQHFANLVLIDAQSRQRLNTLRPYGSPLPEDSNPALRRILAEGRPVVTDLFEGPVVKRPLFAVGVPVRRHGKVAYSLNAGIFPERVARALAQPHLPESWIAVIVDSSGTVVARSHESARYVGQKAAPALVARMAREAEGSLDAETLEGTGVVSVFSRAPESGWSVAIGVPRAELQKRALLAAARTAIIGFIVLAVALAVGLTVVRRLGQS